LPDPITPEQHADRVMHVTKHAGVRYADDGEMRAAILGAIREAVEAEREQARLLYGAGSSNGDVLDWLAAWVDDPDNQCTVSALKLFAARARRIRGG